MRLGTTSWLIGLTMLAGCGTPQSSNASAVDAAAGGQTAAANAAAKPVTTVADDSATADNAATGAATGAAALLADVAAFRARRDECDHFRGEEPTDAARAAFLEKALERTCKGTDAQLIALRERHAGQPAVIAALADYEEAIE